MTAECGAEKNRFGSDRKSEVFPFTNHRVMIHTGMRMLDCFTMNVQHVIEHCSRGATLGEDNQLEFRASIDSNEAIKAANLIEIYEA